ncbi:hypothetical protein BD626DRAFT_534656 [Schizophyllum amplum]|uniref:Uncharacterized protein n=1 Tax=Schizophyllum amplum TaxID=97359 RepID=A0A550CVA7_9AGAR|nr:hypothetical protein BD626DRAFT_534656 [Auriculariopsis ampla]
MPSALKTKSSNSSRRASGPYDRRGDASLNRRKNAGQESALTTSNTELKITRSRALKGHGTVQEIVACIPTLRGNSSVEVKVMYEPGQPPVIPKAVIAPQIRSLVLSGNSSHIKGRELFMQFLNALRVPNAKMIAILWPGRSTSEFEDTIYSFLTKAGSSGNLQTVILSLQCCYRPGLKDYLRSPEAEHLVSLSLHTNADVEAEILCVLPHRHWLFNLEDLTLRNANNIKPRFFLEALEKRHAGGRSKLSSVRITAVKGLSKAVVERARAIGIEFECFRSVYVKED